MTNAQWPFDQEIFYHLDLVPYIDLQVEFNPEAMLKEAFALDEHFVQHRAGDQSNAISEGKWKSLGLRSYEGDPSKTEYHTSYTAEEMGVYKNTQFLERCPETKKFLEQLTDIDQCDRIRFMLLEPGTEIKTHSDSRTRDVSFAVNVSLNMPEGCTFWSHLNEDGSSNEFSLKIPFSNNGSVFLFNNAKYHSLKNASSVPRMHIIFHGPIRFTDEAILVMARQQNSLFNRKGLLKNLVRKKALIGETFAKSPVLLKDWISSGLESDSLGKDISLLVLDHAKDDFSLAKITQPSLFPLQHTVVKDLDSILSLQGQAKFAVICMAGTYINNLNSFIIELFKQIRLMKSSQAVAAGHILDRGNEEAPHFHQQFLILDLELWRQLGKPSLGEFFSSEKNIFPAYARGTDLHDDYTPEFIVPGAAVPSRTGFFHWGSSLIKIALENSCSVINLSPELRKAKDYSYPLDQKPEALKKIQNEIADRAEVAKEDVYFFNNENLQIATVRNFKPEMLVSVAAGFKPVKILEQYKFDKKSRIVFTDFSHNALQYIKTITAQKDIGSLILSVDKFIKILQPNLWSKGLTENILRATIRDYFEGDEKSFLHYLSLASMAQFEEMNFVLNPEALVNVLEENRPFVIWVSNAFYNNHVFHLLGVEESEQSFNTLAVMIANRFGVSAYRENISRNILIGNSVDNPIGLLTDGCTQFISEEVEAFTKLN